MGLELLAAALTAAVGAALLMPIVIAAGVADVPDRARKIHAAATPTTGGLGVAFGFALALALIAFWPGTVWEQAVDDAIGKQIGFAVAFSFGALLLGLWDDLRPLSARTKTALMVALAVGVTVFVARADSLPVVGAYAVRLDVWLAVLGSALWIYVLMNATNFMDGLNGLALGSAGISLTGLAILSLFHNAYAAAALSLAGAGGILGFLIWNFPAGKVFAGDTGALFIGMLSAIAALMAIHEGGISPFAMPILFFPTLADALLTLAWRVHKRRNLFDGHLEHFYQVALRGGVARNQITILYWLATAGCVAVALTAYILKLRVSPVIDDWVAAGLPSAIGEGLAFLLSMLGKVCLAILIVASIWVSGRVRQFAVARGIAAEES